MLSILVPHQIHHLRLATGWVHFAGNSLTLCMLSCVLRMPITKHETFPDEFHSFPSPWTISFKKAKHLKLIFPCFFLQFPTGSYKLQSGHMQAIESEVSLPCGQICGIQPFFCPWNSRVLDSTGKALQSRSLKCRAKIPTCLIWWGTVAEFWNTFFVVVIWNGTFLCWENERGGWGRDETSALTLPTVCLHASGLGQEMNKQDRASYQMQWPAQAGTGRGVQVPSTS